jgi:hypothetical protein
MDEARKDQILAHLGLLAMQTCMEWPLDEVSGSVVYHIPHASWQAGELAKYHVVSTVTDAAAFEQAVQSPAVRAIFVPHTAEVTQGIARSILLRNPLHKQIFWEACKAIPDAELGAAADGGGM